MRASTLYLFRFHILHWSADLIRKNNYTQNLKILAPIGTKKSVTEIFIGEKEKLTNKGTNKRYVAVLLHNATHHYQVLYQISVSYV